MNQKAKIIKELTKLKEIKYSKYRSLLSRYHAKNRIFSKSELLEVYKSLLKEDKIDENHRIEKFLKTKPSRTVSGVVPVTVLTKPYNCPGKCIFCPTRSDQPKSYLSSEPGAMRAKMLKFDPFIQTKVRMQALKNIGHNTEKIELIILGGTWSYYHEKYQIWFITECFRALNERSKSRSITRENNIELLKRELIKEQKLNESAKHRCVGLVVETRPDFVDEDEVKRMRFLGVTKVQLGVQTLDNKLLKLNQRGHSVRDSIKAIKLLRLAGFKLHIHWMVNLYASDIKNDFNDFKKLFKKESMKPDEIKLYPCLLLEGTKLYEYYLDGKYKPYSKNELLELLIKCKKIIPEYCRVSRLFRDIPSFEIVDGVKETNFRQIVKKEMKERGLECNCIRCREIRDSSVKIKNIVLKMIKYKTNVNNEYFLSYVTNENKIIGFLRLSVPLKKYSEDHFIRELRNSAIIREVHVYGISSKIKSKNSNVIQHKGIGTKLVKKAEVISKRSGYNKISVISAIGTRNYYKKLGYRIDKLYMSKEL